MKIAHLADIHLSELTGPIKDGQNARMMDTVKCMEYAAERLSEEQPDIILIAGDLFHKSKLWADEMLKEITIAASWLRRLTTIAPTVLMFGTANHDNVKAFENIRDMSIPDLTVIIDKPELFIVNTGHGRIQVGCIPGMDKGQFRTLFPSMDMEDENKAISESLGNVILGLGADADPSIPLILMSHYTVTGCELENGETVFLNSDIVIPTAALAASNYDLVCLGHIHKAQSIPNCSRPVYYSGPVNAISFNEEGQDKGFWIHEINKDLPYDNVDSSFIKTPSREFATIEMDSEDIDYFIRNGRLVDSYKARDRITRVIYSCDDELNKQFNKKTLEKTLYDAGAFYVSEIRPSKILATVDKNAMSENDTVESNLKTWLERQEIASEDITKVIEIAKPMISQIAASMPTGKLTGVFEPLRLEVKNYRSYLQEEFDFTKVSFATVNGPNGIGKSSFFMDAVADCLYEEPREGELTGWIANGEDIKSGAITFEFLMGSDKWRVIRTRAKSGKTTLALQKWHEDKWEDHSGDKKDQTQEKILNLLGMDALTFKSCALIMQDNYGVFLEADKTERMQVLGNILGLSIYDKLHDLAKDELRVQNRKVEALKSEISTLDEKLKLKGLYEDQLKDAQEEKEITEQALKHHEEELGVIKGQLEKVKEIQLKINSITEQIISITDDIKARETERQKLKTDQERAQNIVNQEDKILAKIKEYEEARSNISTLKAQQSILSQKQADLRKVNSDIIEVQGKINTGKNNIVAIRKELQNKEILEKEVSELPALEEKLIALNKDKITIQELSHNENTLKQKVLNAEALYKNKVDKISEELKECRKKAELIENSNCPVDNPSCNFLKDALEAKNNIPVLIDELNNADYSEVEAANKAYQEAKTAYETFKYSFNEHENIKKLVTALRIKKEQLLSLSSKSELLNNYLQQESELNKNFEELQTKKSKLESEIKLLEAEIDDLKELEKALPVLEHWYKGKDELPAAKQLLKTVNERLQVLDNEISIKNNEIISIESTRDNLCDEVAAMQVSEGELQTVENEIKHLRNELTNIEVSIGVATSKIEEFEKDEAARSEKAIELQEYATKSNELSLLSRAFCIDGIPFQIVRSVVSELSAQSNEILSQMTGGKMAIEMKTEKVLRNKNEVNALEIWISDYQRGTMPYLSRSGGQKVKAALSVAFALADLKANRAGIQLGMMFIDEPPFLDAEGTQAYADALELMHNRYESMKVIAISHDPTMKARFPQSIDVMDAGDKGSKILFNA